MPKNKKKEDILARKRELEKRRYEKIKNNPELYAKYKEKNKAKYQKRKNEGKVLSINNLTQRDQKMLRRKWREEAKKSYQRKKEEKERIQRFMDCNSPPTSDIENIDVNNIHDISIEKPSTSSDPNSEYKRITRSRSREVSPANSQVSSASSGITPNAQKLVRKLRYKKDKEIASLRLKLQSVIKLNETYRKRISRIRPLQDNNNLHGNVHSEDSEPQVHSSPLAGTFVLAI
ncbi:unnamed protein product [Colias eurytheme]|nr:unnamed protein product [Colias eurytheme]